MAQLSRVGKTATSVFTDEYGALCCIYHATCVAKRQPDGSIELDSGGWRTVTTKTRMNQFAHQYCERGVFLSLDEFEPYFKAGWRGASNTNAAMRKHMGEPVAQCSRAVADMIDPSRHLYMEGLIELID